MSLDGMFKTNKQGQQDKNYSEMDDGQYRSRSEEETASASARKAAKRTSKKNTTEDPLLPEKKRARRRLIGALALVLAAIIGLPMVFDSEPKPTNNKITIEIPSKDVINEAQEDTQNLQKNSNNVAPTLPAKATVADQKRAVLPVQQSIDATEEVVPPPTTSVKKPAATEVKPEKKEVEKNLVAEKKPEAKPSIKIEPKAEPKIDTKVVAKPEVVEKKDNKDEAARAFALLEGRAVAPQEKKTEAGFALQVGAYSTKEKIRELQTQLKTANINSYTQKIITKSGEITRIRVGPFATKVEAEKIRTKLMKLGLNGTLIPQ